MYNDNSATTGGSNTPRTDDSSSWSQKITPRYKKNLLPKGVQPTTTARTSSMHKGSNVITEVFARNVPEREYYDGQVAALAVKALRSASRESKPFFLAIGFGTVSKPPYRVSGKYYDSSSKHKHVHGSTEGAALHTPTSSEKYIFPTTSYVNQKFVEFRGSQKASKSSRVQTMSDTVRSNFHKAYSAGVSLIDWGIGQVCFENYYLLIICFPHIIYYTLV